MFTCISCKIAFETPAEQRSHFATDWHRYNMKRRVANLPPIAVDTFNAKVIERREQNAVRADPRGMHCQACSKSFSTENAYRSHVQSKKHRDKESAAILAGARATLADIAASLDAPTSSSSPLPTSANRISGSAEESQSEEDEASDEDEKEDEEGEEMDLETRLAAARNRLKPSDCLFCSQSLRDIPSVLEHMSRLHSFFIPDQDELIDVNGLLSYLGEKVSIGNICLYCPNGGKEFGSLDAVRKHMQSKAHCKIAFDTHEDRAELADYYEWGIDDEGSDWEDVDGEDGADTDGMELDGDADRSRRTNRTQRGGLPSLAADGLSLQLPNGRILGHRALRVYYQQRLRPYEDDPEPRRSIKDAINKEKGLIPVSGGYGAFGKGQQLMKARNAGEAAWAKKQAGSHWEARKAEAQRARVAMKVHNNQKHFRDPNMP